MTGEAPPGVGTAPDARALAAEFLLDPEVVFLNHGSFGACPRPVFEVYQAWQRELERQPVSFLQREFPGLMAQARSRLAGYVGAAADDLVYVPNATTGVNVVARSLGLGPGDEVVTTDHEYGACDRTWRFLCAKRGAAYRRVALPLPVTSADEVVERVWSAVGPRTRVLFISQITSPTALTLPVAPLVARAREAGVLTLVDGAHVPGQLPLDVEALGADFYTGNCHKWLCAPKGAGFLHARREVQGLLEPLVVSWGWEPEVPGPSRFVDEQEWTGTRDVAAYLSVPAAIDYEAARAWPEVQARCRALARRARAGLVALPGIGPVASDDESWTAQMAAVVLPAGTDVEALKARLYDDHRVEVPTLMWEGRPMLRVSVQGYNSYEDVDALVGAVEACLVGLGVG